MMSGSKIIFGGAAIGRGNFSNVKEVRSLLEELQKYKIS